MGRGYHNSSDAVAALLHPEYGYREQQKQRGNPQKDYQHINILRIKQMQRRQKEEQKAKEELEKRRHSFSQFKLEKFQSIPARYSAREPRIRSTDERATSSPYMEDKQRSSINEHENAEGSSSMTMNPPRRTHSKEGVPTNKELRKWNENAEKDQNRKKSVDYIRRNAKQAFSRPSLQLEKEETIVRHGLHVDKDFGKVPLYLVKRRIQWAKEESERRKQQNDPECPKGMVRMSEEERQSTLRVLQNALSRLARKKVVEKKWNALPLRLETMRQQQRKTALEAKLEEIEKAIRVFSQKKVFVAKDMLESARTPIDTDIKDSNSDEFFAGCVQPANRPTVTAA